MLSVGVTGNWVCMLQDHILTCYLMECQSNRKFQRFLLPKQLRLVFYIVHTCSTDLLCLTCIFFVFLSTTLDVEGCARLCPAHRIFEWHDGATSQVTVLGIDWQVHLCFSQGDQEQLELRSEHGTLSQHVIKLITHPSRVPSLLPSPFILLLLNCYSYEPYTSQHQQQPCINPQYLLDAKTLIFVVIECS